MNAGIEKDHLRTLPLLAGLPEEDLEILRAASNVRAAAAGEMLFDEGDPVEHISFILEGQVEIIRSLGMPEERLLAQVGPGDFLGEMSAFKLNPRRLAAARACLPTRSLEIPIAQIVDLILRRPLLALQILEELTERISNNEAVNIRNLREKNRRLEQAYLELQTAQAQLIEKEKIEHELALARRIQEQSLPGSLPSLPGWSLAAAWQPARQVSGDFYDALADPGRSLKFLIADVSGKGVPAALGMATSRAILHTLMARIDTPGALLAAANEQLIDELSERMFVTCFFAILDLPTGRMRFANAGQNLPYHLAADGPHALHAVGFPLGLLPGRDYIEGETVIRPGEGLLFYSDGLVEAHSPAGELFGNPRLAAYLASQPQPRLDLALLLHEVQRFTGDAPQEDDITLLNLARAP